MELSCQTQIIWFTIWWWIRPSWTKTLGRYWFFIDFDLKRILRFAFHWNCHLFNILYFIAEDIFGSAKIPDSSLVWFIFYNLDPLGFLFSFYFCSICWNFVKLYSEFHCPILLCINNRKRKKQQNNKAVYIYRTTLALCLIQSSAHHESNN